MLALTYNPKTQVIMKNDQVDKFLWKSNDGSFYEFAVKHAWEDFREHGNEASWAHLVWSTYAIPGHAIHMWLVMRKRLLTQDRMKQWHVGNNVDVFSLRCPLCKACPDSHEHLFFECIFSSKVWNLGVSMAGISFASSKWSDIVNWLLPIANQNKVETIVGRLIVAASAYYV